MPTLEERLREHRRAARVAEETIIERDRTRAHIEALRRERSMCEGRLRQLEADPGEGSPRWKLETGQTPANYRDRIEAIDAELARLTGDEAA